MNNINHEAIGEAIPNLDDPNIDFEAIRYQAKFVAITFNNLATYAEAKKEAIYHRKEGRIPVALSLEKYADELYKKLPSWAQW